MKKIFLPIAILLMGSLGFAQETIVWGSEVIDVSSEYSPYGFSAVQVIHRPNVYPNSGESPNAWRPGKPDTEEFIMVAFDAPIKAKQVAIAETENPGAIKQIFAYDADYNEYQIVPNITPRDLPIEKRLLNLYFPETPYEVHAVRVVLDGAVNEGFNAIDAIGISDSNVPISVLMNVLPDVNNELEADKLGEEVNSDAPENSPIISPDGNRLYFSRQFHPDNVGGEKDSEDIWVSEKDPETGLWLPAENVGAPLNTKGPNFVSSINMIDDKEVFILGNRYGVNGRMYMGVSMTTRNEDGTFTEPVPLDIENEYNYAPTADFYLAPGGEALLMSAERDDTYGLRDIYVSFKQEDGTYSEPENLGTDINSIGDEKAPFLSPDGKTLYFSSDGYNGYGGQDIFVSFRLEEGNWKKWSEPENLGAGVNKKGDDEYLSVPSSGTQIYFSRTTQGRNTDIFSFEMEDLFVETVDVENTKLASSMAHLDNPDTPKREGVEAIAAAGAVASEVVETEEGAEAPVAETEPEDVTVTISGVVMSSKTNAPLENAVIKIDRLPDGLNIGEVNTDEKGTFSFAVKAGSKYSMVGEADGYISQAENFDFTDVAEPKAISKNITVSPIAKGESVVLNNIFFDFDKALLKTSSYPELNRVLEFMTDNRIKKIELHGYTDSVGEDAYNLSLSGERAQTVIEYLVNNGISEDRLAYKAFGEAKPVASNNTVEGRAQNRRVEFVIVE